MWESRRDFQRVWEGWEAGFMAFHAFHTLLFHGLLFIGAHRFLTSALAIWHSSRLNSCLTRVTKEKKASDKGIPPESLEGHLVTGDGLYGC
jgi:hypothetical protein